MTNHHAGEPWPGLTYGGFTGGARAPHAAEPEEMPSRSNLSKRGLIGGVAAALLAGVLFGVFARPELDRAAAPAAEPMGSGPPVPVEVAPMAPAPLPATTGKLEVLPRDLEPARGVAVIPPPPPPLPPERRLEPARAIEPQAPPTPRIAESAPPAPRAQAAAEPGFNCNAARTRSEQMVCGDPGLASLDRRLNAAFRMAVNAGVPYRELRADQDDWLEIREDAAAYSRGAVASIYRQRISELEGMAEGR